MKNFFLGLAVVAFAFSASAFTNVNPNDVYVEGTDGIYRLIPGSTFNPNKCQSVNLNVCAFKVVTTEELPIELTKEEADALDLTGEIESVKQIGGAPYLGHYQP